jgi:hypothetical protein
MPELEAQYERAIPEQWDKGLRFPETAVHTDRESLGISLSWLAISMWWLNRAYFPWNDSEGLLLDRWERWLGLQPSGTIDERVARIVAKMRLRGTGSLEVMLSILAPAFGVPEGSDYLQVAAPDLSTVVAENPGDGDPGWQDASELHFHSGGNLTLDGDLADSILREITPSGSRWTAGSELVLRDGLELNRGVAG